MANITVTLFWDMDLRKWTTTLAGTTETAPQTGIVQGDIVKFAVRFVQGGVAVALTAPVFTASGIKADNDFTGSYLIQLSAPVLSDTTLYTFTVSPLNSANLNTFLQTYRNTWCVLELFDSANGILTTPLELQITPGYSLSGTPTDNQPGVVSVAAGKTVTFPLSLTFPAAAGTNGYHLALLNATTGTTEWVADATGSGTVTTTGAMTADTIVLSNGTTVIKSTTTGAGVVTALGNTPNATGGIVTFSGNVGAATATSINGITITAGGTGTLTMYGNINTGGSIGSPGGEITTANGGGDINTAGAGSIQFGVAGSRTTLIGNGSGNGSINLPNVVNSTFTLATTDDITGGTLAGSFTTLDLRTTGTRTTFRGNAATTDKTIDLPNLTGTVALTSDITGGTLAGSFTTVNIPATTSSVGQITQAGVPLLHSFKNAASTGSEVNLWIGGAGNLTLTGSSGASDGLLNIGLGRNSLASATTTSGNMAIGKGTLGSLTTSASYNNVAIGNQCMDLTTTAIESIGIGTNCQRSISSHSSVSVGVLANAGQYSVSIGHNAMNGTVAGALACVAVGRNCMSSVTGERNTAVGHQAGTTLTTGTYNSLFGEGAQTGSATATYRTAIGAGATGTANNQVMLGRAADAVVVPGTLAVTGGVSFAKTITEAATTGAQTINKTSGSVNFAAAATSLVVTNSLVTTSSVILCTVATNDATATFAKVVAAAGSFTIYITAATAETRVNFLVTN
jgi:hypothetical protein